MPADEEINQLSDLDEDSTLPNHAKNDEVTGDKQSDGQLDGQDEAEHVDDRGLSRKVADWARAHPYQVAIQVGTVVVMVTPAAVAAHVLGVFGFGAGGLGSAATTYQASHGPIVAQSIFATLQSAGAGGYGVPIVHDVVRAGSALFSHAHGTPITAAPSIKRAFATSPQHHLKNRVYTSVRNPEEFTSLLLLSSTNRTPLITLWTASWCSPCRTIKPLLLSLIEDQSIGEQEGGVGYAEVEIDSPTIGPLASQYFVNTIPTLLSFRAQEAVLEEKVVSVDEMKDREFMRMWIENEARRGGDRGGGGGISTGLFGGLFGLGDKH
ncbi:hypothetical protein Q9189_000521 [Teloschistes chrysophthalmus]